MGRLLVSDPAGPCGDHRSESQNLAVVELQFPSLFIAIPFGFLRKRHGMSLDTGTVV